MYNVQNNKIKKLTSKIFLMYFSSVTLYLLFLAYEFFKTWNYVANSYAHICMCIHTISRFRLDWQNSAKSWLA